MLETWVSHHEHEEHPEWTVEVLWCWFRVGRGYEPRAIAATFSMFVPEDEQTVLVKWLQNAVTF